MQGHRSRRRMGGCSDGLSGARDAGATRLFGSRSGCSSVLDSVRAAKHIPDAHAGSRFVIRGHSQGGHATLSAGAVANSYAPELQIVGMVAASPPTRLADILAGMDATPKGPAQFVPGGKLERILPRSAIDHRRQVNRGAD
jgi:pimeloyl-ACP methyl ester carboxylesterase